MPQKEEGVGLAEGAVVGQNHLQVVQRFEEVPEVEDLVVPEVED